MTDPAAGRVRAIPVHEVVRHAFPRPPPEAKDEIAMAIGRAIDGMLAQFGYELRSGRRPTATALRRLGESLLDDALEEAAVEVPPDDLRTLRAQIAAMLPAYRQSPIAGLGRPKTHVVRIGPEVAVYAQPDYWDGRARFYEMKSYRAIPPPPDVGLQLRLFQLAFPGFEAVLVCLNRHVLPVEVATAHIPPPTAAEASTALRLAYDVGRESGEEKVLAYMEGPFVHYPVPPPAAGDGAAPPAGSGV